MINLEDKKMTNNKQQTEINAVEYLDKVNQFAKENNRDKPKQQTAVEWLLNAIETKNGEEFSSYYTEFIEQAKEMEQEQKSIKLPTNEELWLMSEQHALKCGLENIFDEDGITIIKHHWAEGYKKAVNDFLTYGGGNK